VVKVLDFGLAKMRREAENEQPLTGYGTPMGTPAYMAPEQFRDSAQADSRADIYSLGCSLYYLLTGHPPFQGAPIEVLWSHTSREAEPLHQVRPDVPEELSAIVAKMMAKDPAQRYQTPIEAAQALMPFIASAKRTSTMEKNAEVTLSPSNRDTSTEQSPNQAKETAQRWDTLIATSKPTLQPQPAGSDWKHSSPLVGHRRGIGMGLLVCLALFILVSLAAGIVFKLNTKKGTIVVENLPADVEVQVNDNQVTIRPTDGKSPGVPAPANKKHQEPAKAGAAPAEKPPLPAYALRLDGRQDRIRIPKSSFKFYGSYSLTVEVTVIPYECTGYHTVLADAGMDTGFYLALSPKRQWVLGSHLKQGKNHPGGNHQSNDPTARPARPFSGGLPSGIAPVPVVCRWQAEQHRRAFLGRLSDQPLGYDHRRRSAPSGRPVCQLL
jgi:hypothetical protein